MQLPFTLPDWAPPWVGFVIIVVGVLFLLAFLLMPFNVFGLKGRLDGVEARLDEIQREIRILALRLPEPGRTEYEPEPEDRQRWSQPQLRPPIPPRLTDYDRPPPPSNRRVPPSRQTRSEPRLDPS
jgi:hypothetical protein